MDKYGKERQLKKCKGKAGDPRERDGRGYLPYRITQNAYHEKKNVLIGQVRALSRLPCMTMVLNMLKQATDTLDNESLFFASTSIFSLLAESDETISRLPLRRLLVEFVSVSG